MSGGREVMANPQRQSVCGVSRSWHRQDPVTNTRIEVPGFHQWDSAFNETNYQVASPPLLRSL
jgi:hypothetical protein